MAYHSPLTFSNPDPAPNSIPDSVPIPHPNPNPNPHPNPHPNPDPDPHSNPTTLSLTLTRLSFLQDWFRQYNSSAVAVHYFTETQLGIAVGADDRVRRAHSSDC